jgi:hypothetical protein
MKMRLRRKQFWFFSWQVLKFEEWEYRSGRGFNIFMRAIPRKFKL